MPSGSLQVLGAHAAMAAHRRGAAPPKHGAILFSMPQISRSPRWVRGKIARFLAGKASIAVRCDHFGGEPWDEEMPLLRFTKRPRQSRPSSRSHPSGSDRCAKTHQARLGYSSRR